MGTFTRGDMYSHTRSAENERPFKVTFGKFRADTKPYSVEHQIGVFVRIAVGGNT